jgi:hypothetical protein
MEGAKGISAYTPQIGLNEEEVAKMFKESYLGRPLV